MKKIIILSIAILLANCNTNSKPKKLLSKQKMIELLYDIEMYNALHSYHFPKDTMYYYHTKTDIFKRYGIDSLEFVANQDYYQKDLKQYAQMYEQIKQKIAKKIEQTQALPDQKEDQDEGTAMSVSPLALNTSIAKKITK